MFNWQILKSTYLREGLISVLSNNNKIRKHQNEVTPILNQDFTMLIKFWKSTWWS